MPKHRLALFLAALVAAVFAAEAPAVVQLSAASASAPPGGTVETAIAFTGVSDAPTIVILELSFDAARLTPLGGAILGPGVPAQKSFEWNIVDNRLIAIVYSIGSAFTAQNSMVFYFQVAMDAPNGVYTITRSGGSATNADYDDLATTLAPFSITVAQNLGTHNADSNRDWSVSLSEVLRIIQFYNTGVLHCALGTEDGFAPGPGDQTCSPHDSDYNPVDWDVDLGELLRIIQFYNFVGGSYHPDGSGEDGYTAGPF